MASFPTIAARPPGRIACDADVDALRHWAFAALAAGRGRDVIRALDALDDSACPGQAWADAWTELHVRTGIALDDRDLVATAAIELAGGTASQLAAPALLAVGIGAAWLVEDGARHDAPASRFGELRPWLTAARWTLARVLSHDGLDVSSVEEGAAALDSLYAGAWRTREALWPGGEAGGDGGMRGERSWGWLERTAGAPPAEQASVAQAVLAGVAEAVATAEVRAARSSREGRRWWRSADHGVAFDVSTPETAAERHRFALADVFLEVEELGQVELEGDDAEVLALEAAHRHELARHAVAHAVGARLVLP